MNQHLEKPKRIEVVVTYAHDERFKKNINKHVEGTAEFAVTALAFSSEVK